MLLSLAAIIAAAYGPGGAKDGQIIYQVESTTAPTSNNAYAFVEREQLVAGYVDGQSSPDALNPKDFHEYKKDIYGDVLTLSFRNISLPKKIGPAVSWKSGDRDCKATPRHGNDPSELLISCSIGYQTVSVYVFGRGKGVTGFFAPCFGEFSCWYQLRSSKGLLADWPS